MCPIYFFALPSGQRPATQLVSVSYTLQPTTYTTTWVVLLT